MVGSRIIPKSKPNNTTPAIIVKNIRFEGTFTTESIRTDKKVVSAEVVNERPIRITVAAALSPPFIVELSVSTKACVI